MSKKRTLTLAPPEAEQIVRELSGSGQETADLAKTPLAEAEYASVAYGPPTRRFPGGRWRGWWDTSYLCRFHGTNYCQWYGRARSGHFIRFGRILEIVEVTP